MSGGKHDQQTRGLPGSENSRTLRVQDAEDSIENMDEGMNFSTVDDMETCLRDSREASPPENRPEDYENGWIEDDPERLSILLAAWRDIARRLITPTQSPAELARGVCTALAGCRCYGCAWVCLFDSSDQPEIISFSNGHGAAIQSLEIARGEALPCNRTLLSDPRAKTTSAAVSLCGKCPVARRAEGSATIGIRLEHQGKVYGMLSVSIPIESTSDEEKELLLEIARGLSFSLHYRIREENARQSKHEHARLERLTAGLAPITETIARMTDLNEMLAAVLDAICKTLTVKHAAVFIPDGRKANPSDPAPGESPVVQVRRELTEEEVSAIAAIAAASKKAGSPEPHLLLDPLVDSSSLFPPPVQKSLISSRKIRALLIVPVESAGGQPGMICAMTRGDRTFAADEIRFLSIAGKLAGIGVRKAFLEGIAARAEKLDELDRLRTGLMASISHELRTPLTSIKGIASTLVQSDVQWDAETQRDFLQTLNQESDKLTRIVSDLLEMSQLEAGIMRLEKTHTTLAAITAQLKDQLKLLADGHRFEMDIPPDLPELYVDEVRLGEVITNLISNAAAYSDKGTRIILQARRNGDEIVVSVSDEGIGIPKEHIGKIFSRFYRLESGAVRRRGGTGLGLAISEGIVEQHGGRIWVESEVGRGSTFSFAVPITA